MVAALYWVPVISNKYNESWFGGLVNKLGWTLSPTQYELVGLSSEFADSIPALNWFSEIFYCAVIFTVLFLLCAVRSAFYPNRRVLLAC